MDVDAAEEQIIQVFEKFDVDGNGKLTFDELLDVMDRIAPGTFSVLDIVTLFDQMDIDEDETIQYEEFVHWCCNEGEGPVVDKVLELANLEGLVNDEGQEGTDSFPMSGEEVEFRTRPKARVEVTKPHREGLGFEGGHRMDYDGGFIDAKYNFGAVVKGKYGEDGDVMEMGVNLGAGVAVNQGVRIGTDKNQRGELTYGFGQGAGFGVGAKLGTDRTGAAVVQASALGFGCGFSGGGDHTFGIKLKAFGYDVGFKLVLRGLRPQNAIERRELQSTFKWKIARNTMTAAKNYARGLIKKDQQHRFCTITEHFAVAGSHYTVKVYDAPDDCPLSFDLRDGHHEILYDDQFIGKDFAEGEFLKFNRKSVRRGRPPQLMNEVGYTEEFSQFAFELCEDGMIMLKYNNRFYVAIGDDSEVTILKEGEGEGTAFTVREVTDKSGRFVLEPETHHDLFLGRSDDKVVKLTDDVGEAQMRAIPTGELKGSKLFAFRFGR